MAVDGEESMNKEMHNHPETAVSLSEKIHHSLWEKIVTLQYMPGEKLSEAGIARELNCSRIPVREAIKRLASEGALDVYPQRGSFVSRIDLRQVSQTRYLREILETHVVLEDYDKGLLDPLVPILNTMVHQQLEKIKFNELEDLTSLDNDFHDIFYHIDDKGFVQKHTGRYDVHYIRARRFALGIEHDSTHRFDDTHNIVLQHQKIIDAITRHDKQGLSDMLVEHFRNINYTLHSQVEAGNLADVFCNVDDH
jgi:DNA-binding GntR family transcriptional regulator